MSQQPEAIRLAAVCDLGHPLEDDVVLIGQELRRLHAVERLQAAVQVPDASETYKRGWVACAGWAKRPDLIADIDSPAYANERAARLATPQPEPAWSPAYTRGPARQSAPVAAVPALVTDAALIRELVDHIERNTCTHEGTHRGGAIWEVCDSCGARWADDEGGKPEFKWPAVVEKARAILALRPERVPLTEEQMVSAVRPLCNTDQVAERLVAVSIDEYRAIEAASAKLNGLTVGDGAHSGALHCKTTWWRWVGTPQHEHGRATYYCSTVNETTVSLPNFEQALALAMAIEAQARETRQEARHGLLQEIGRIEP